MLNPSIVREMNIMLHETLKALRKQKGYSQEEAAARLNVVRQTVSKWEKGLSVPDADALVRLAELYEVSVGELLGAPPQTDESAGGQPDLHEIAEQLSRINEQLVIRNRRSGRIWKIVGIIAASYVIFYLLSIFLFSVSFKTVTDSETTVTMNELLDGFSPGP